MAIIGDPESVRSAVPVFSMVKIKSVSLPGAWLPKSWLPPSAMSVLSCLRLISVAVPVPLMLKLYGFSSESSLAILIVADLIPVVLGSKRIVKVVLLPAVTGVDGSMVTVKSAP